MYWHNAMNQSLIQHSLQIGQEILNQRTSRSRKDIGQFLTPEPLALYMASQLEVIQSGEHILDPAMGSGTLLCATIERLINEGNPVEVSIDGFELDQELLKPQRLYWLKLSNLPVNTISPSTCVCSTLILS